jgi:hypothetical protein
VKREGAEAFLEKALTQLGLVGNEIFAFVVFWAPIVRQRDVSFVHFLTDEYASTHPLKVEPMPDVQIRVFVIVLPGNLLPATSDRRCSRRRRAWASPSSNGVGA